ncbi:hypothetical protein BD410DRAFT_281458 [Rickenella mellea]|uniref:F-box domain-containing protein n=1 Tax=Rickenella mellea TaxID=50990 RepID=A0A4Y7Q3I4_9AGAM|nr:hypothetical protein BD410DRAFT_281458 [Rickenella mellea]
MSQLPQAIRSFPFQFSTEVLLEIFIWTTPLELLQLRITCRLFKSLLDRQNIWRTARKNMQPPIPDPTLPDDVFNYPTSWCERAYAKYVFGATVCSFCGEKLKEPFFVASYSLKLFSCLKTVCDQTSKRSFQLFQRQVRNSALSTIPRDHWQIKSRFPALQRFAIREC